jgi:hypothetical protein
MNCYDRLKQEYKDRLENEANKYPSTIAKIKKALQDETLIMKLSYDTVSNLHIYIKTDSNCLTTYFNHE